MSDDLVKRLRVRAEFTGPYSALWDEAADRIEKLEAALRDCMETAEVHEIPLRERVMSISGIARKALGGKDG